jgi:hypothetical protein
MAAAAASAVSISAAVELHRGHQVAIEKYQMHYTVAVSSKSDHSHNSTTC